MSFDLDQSLVKADPGEISAKRHVFVSGLARAGTTVLMRKFYETGLFRSLTYRDMPFVLAPNLWGKLTSKSGYDGIEKVERAHGDNLTINLDSPESLDEIYWRIFAGKEYIEREYLRPHTPSEELIQKFIRYVQAILLSSRDPNKRYLSKNNNNILRLGAIHRAFPNALILIPFRNPLQHAYSLLRQHRRFSEIQMRSKFVLSYMTWLGHHEFGLDHRPFVFCGCDRSGYSRDSLDYWLQLWCEVYSWLQRSKSNAAFFVCYEELCENEKFWKNLTEMAMIPVAHKTEFNFKLSRRAVKENVDKNLASRASAIYDDLVTLSQTAFFS